MNKIVKGRLLRLSIGCLWAIFLAISAIFFAGIGYVLFKGKRLDDVFCYFLNFLLTINIILTLFLFVPSLIFSCLMEFFINPKMGNNGLVIFISTALGFFFTVLGVLLYLFSGDSSAVIYYVLDLVIGCLVGLFSGVWLRFIYIRQANGESLPRWIVIINSGVILYFMAVIIYGIWSFVEMTNALSLA